MKFREMTKEQLKEESFIDLGYAVLEEKHESLTLQELLDEIRALNGFTHAQMKERMLQYYTDMNIDGRFLAISENRWGLREWYPVEQIEEETAPTVKVRKKKSKSTDDDDLDETDEDEITFEDDFDEFVEDVDGDEEDFDLDDDDDDVEEIEVEVAVDLVETDDDFEIVEDDEDEDEDEEDEE